ncbi:hypothetical protein GOBAR_DD17575 [Gossypium barbadense]|nr:hypothetical protein GOBAR_DD17575 [Gossypium barbadense]
MLDTDDDDNEQQEEENESLVFQDETFDGKIVDFYNGDGSSDFEEEGEEEVYYYDSDGKLVNLPEDEFDDLGLEVKEKGVPAVMRCFDRAKIYVKAGDGGNGVVAFRREKAGRGAHGQGRMMCGRKGEDVVVKVAPGTVVREAGNDEVLLELLYPGQRALLLPGGRGGRGNASFKSGNNKVPKIAENGEEGPEMWLELELKLVADVGIVGAPNAGKSTLLSVISAAQPEIANYPFTTLLPNLGVVSFDYDSTMVVADLPGLLEGAHRGFGLGHEFLRHTERCSALVWTSSHILQLLYIDSDKRFQHVLEACGVNRSLMKLGVKEGDTVIIGEMEMVWHDSAENSGTPNMKKRSTESIKWPHLKYDIPADHEGAVNSREMTLSSMKCWIPVHDSVIASTCLIASDSVQKKRQFCPILCMSLDNVIAVAIYSLQATSR